MNDYPDCPPCPLPEPAPPPRVADCDFWDRHPRLAVIIDEAGVWLQLVLAFRYLLQDN